MSHSLKKAIVWLTHKIDKSTAHRQVRCKVKVELKKEDPDIGIIESDTRDLGLEDWGTKYNMEYDPAWECDEGHWKDYKDSSKRK